MVLEFCAFIGEVVWFGVVGEAFSDCGAEFRSLVVGELLSCVLAGEVPPFCFLFLLAGSSVEDPSAGHLFTKVDILG